MSIPIPHTGTATWKRRWSRLKKLYRYADYHTACDVVRRKDARRILRAEARLRTDLNG